MSRVNCVNVQVSVHAPAVSKLHQISHTNFLLNKVKCSFNTSAFSRLHTL